MAGIVAHCDSIRIVYESKNVIEVNVNCGSSTAHLQRQTEDGNDKTLSITIKRLLQKYKDSIATVCRVDVAIDMEASLPANLRYLIAKSYSTDEKSFGCFDVDRFDQVTWTMKRSKRRQLQVYNKSAEARLMAELHRFEFRHLQLSSNIKDLGIYAKETVTALEEMGNSYRVAVDNISIVLGRKFMDDQENNKVSNVTSWIRMHRDLIVHIDNIAHVMAVAGLKSDPRDLHRAMVRQGYGCAFISESKFKKVIAVMKAAVKKYAK